MIKYSRVYQHIEAQPHPFDPGSRHPGDHSVLLPGSHRSPDCTHPQRAYSDAQPYGDLYTKRYTYLHRDRDAQPDAYRYQHKHNDDHTQCDIQCDTHLDVYPDKSTNRHVHTHSPADINPAAYMDTHTDVYIFTNPFEYTLPLRYRYS